jgi:hypothetical protein
MADLGKLDHRLERHPLAVPKEAARTSPAPAKAGRRAPESFGAPPAAMAPAGFDVSKEERRAREVENQQRRQQQIRQQQVVAMAEAAAMPRPGRADLKGRQQPRR